MRIVTWNLNHRRTSEAWEYLWSLGPDIALLQEAGKPSHGNALWHPVWDGGWGTAIVAREGLELREILSVPVTSIAPIPAGCLERSHPGAWVAADVDVPDFGSVTVVSVYGLLRRLRDGIDYATTTVQRTLSDLTPILDARSGRVVLAGDLNVSPQIEPRYRAAHVAVIDRLKAFGLMDCLGDKHDGFVQTHRHKNKAGGTPWQLDWVFASKPMKLRSCEADGSERAWALSDHCPVIADFDP